MSLKNNAVRAVLLLGVLTFVGSCGRFSSRFDRFHQNDDAPQSRNLVGSVCSDPRIKGEVIASIPGRIAGCGVENPVRITSVSGVRLTQAATVNCETATALNDWVNNGIKPAVGRRGGGLEALKVVAHYACRTRNNQAGARISEHGKGRAIDIAAIILANGDTITVLDGWRNRRDGKILRAMHASACGPFGTVLGPEANRFHQDHFHVDTASYRSGPYCK